MVTIYIGQNKVTASKDAPHSASRILEAAASSTFWIGCRDRSTRCGWVHAPESHGSCHTSGTLSGRLCASVAWSPGHDWYSDPAGRSLLSGHPWSLSAASRSVALLQTCVWKQYFLSSHNIDQVTAEIIYFHDKKTRLTGLYFPKNSTMKMIKQKHWL